jgi:hypothetical protein
LWDGYSQNAIQLVSKGAEAGVMTNKADGRDRFDDTRDLTDTKALIDALA